MENSIVFRGCTLAAETVKQCIPFLWNYHLPLLRQRPWTDYPVLLHKALGEGTLTCQVNRCSREWESNLDVWHGGQSILPSLHITIIE